MKNTIWRNNKTGNYYKFLHVVTHSETLEKMVVYVSNDGSEKLWVRPYILFMEKFTPVTK
jgi:hypothetical protein